ncbi:MAG: hypothetical protein IJB91_03750 [Oscillospiraceae bacterium]|nr:hypothetical protein [Oscillospiraceae bacterium]
MIADHDRSGYFGASDTDKVIGNWKTKTWEKWWLQKIGINQDHFDNRYTLAGTNWEHRILDSLGLPDLEKDRQILLEDLRLRVNLDGNTPYRIKEVKTYQWAKGWQKTPPKYINQVQVQMFASGIYEADIVAYGLEEADYDNFLRDIDHRRLQQIPVVYDRKWIETVYLPKLRILADCLKRGVFPNV